MFRDRLNDAHHRTPSGAEITATCELDIFKSTAALRTRCYFPGSVIAWMVTVGFRDLIRLGSRRDRRQVDRPQEWGKG